jgi:NADH dehydrogenase FAD-containing subunit
VPHLLVIGGSDAGISASLRACELDPGTDVTMVVADTYPNFQHLRHTVLSER